jgi:penicillin G amidase
VTSRRPIQSTGAAFAAYLRPLSRYTFVLPYLFGAILLLFLFGIAAIYFAARSSLPQIDGKLSASALTSSATISRDDTGVPAIRATTRNDLAFATGVAHAQDRFFQMDLMRRSASGELAALLGPSLVEADRTLRLHQFRTVASEVIRSASEREREVLAAYTAGVNLVLDTTPVRPWEYLLLRAQPKPWSIEDSVLVAFSMYLSLHDSNANGEIARAYLRENLPAELFAFMHPVGTAWDAPIVGGPWRTPPIPAPEIFDLRKADIGSHTQARSPRVDAGREARLDSLALNPVLRDGQLPGSNSWAVAGSHTANGAALLANDMHLPLRLPNVWYQARLIVDAAGDEQRDLAGVTLAGLPLLIVGSNGSVAWGYTNSYGDWADLVIVEVDPTDPDRYLTREGAEPFRIRRERIEVNGESAVEIEIKATRWGPVVQVDRHGRPLVLAWTAHHARATNLAMMEFETARSVDELLNIANRAGTPVQNIVAADAAGHIGWSLMGQVPVRGDYDSTVPSSWRASGSGWVGWREPDEYPRVIDPPNARLWTANTRTIDAQTWFAFLGEGRYDLGARGAQIRDALLTGSSFTAQDMAKLQIDDRALFLTRWRDLLLEILETDAAAQDEQHRHARELVQSWSGRAAAEDPGYRIVRAFRNQVRADVFESLIAGARAQAPDAQFTPSPQFEGPLWALVTERPMHLLDPRYESWPAALQGSLETVLADLLRTCDSLRACAWGGENTLSMRHPLSAALPILGRWTDMPATPMHGDAAMPRVQGPKFGASERLVVSPGREAEGLFQMPGGPSGHPLSPFYGAGHEGWVRGESRPLLPGEPQYVLTLTPSSP